MAYLVIQILAWLVAAGVLGVILGWSVQRARSARELSSREEGWREQLEGSKARWSARVEEKEEQLDRFREVVDAQEARMTALTEDLKAKADSQAELQLIFDSVQGRLSQLEVQVQERDGRILRMEEARRDEIAEKEAEISGLRGRIEELRSLEEDLEERESRLENLVQRVRELEPFEVLLAQRDEERKELEEAHAAELRRRDEEVQRLRHRIQQLAEGPSREARITAGEAEGAAEAEEDGEGEAGEKGEEEGDDLTRISGIGPVFERALRELGYRRFKDIAAWDASELNRVARELGSFPSRVRRDRWVEQARALHLQDHGEAT